MKILPLGVAAVVLFSGFLLSGSRFALSASDTSAPPSGPPGAEIYASQCSFCHGASLNGGPFAPTLKSPGFVAKWSGRRDDLAKYVMQNMPKGNAGSLSDAAYAEVVDYIAQANGGLTASQTNAAGVSPADQWSVGPNLAPPQTFRDATYDRSVAEKHARLAALTTVTEDMLRAPPPRDWLNWRRTQDGKGFSPLAQIDRKTAKSLTVKWAWSLPLGTNEMAPIVHDGVMFVTSNADVEALDATDGTLLWHYHRQVPPQFLGVIGTTQRSFAIFGDDIYVSTPDRHVVALDAKSGTVVWDQEVVPANAPMVKLSTGPFVAGGIIIQGTSVGPGCVGGCFVVGLDPKTGNQLWRFNTVARPGSPGGDTWNETPVEDRSGGANWVDGSYDPKLDLYYFGTGSTYGVSTLLKPKDGKLTNNDALYTDTTLALRPKTGKLVWYHQHLPGDVWDLDEAFDRVLMELPVDGKDRQLVVVTGKNGILDALDRADGSYVFSKDFGLNNFIASIDPKTGRRTPKPDKILVANHPVTVCPSAEGTRNWMATAYNPQTHILYLPMEEMCMDITWYDNDKYGLARGWSDIGWHLRPMPGSDGKYGHLEAVDMLTRKTIWSVRDRYPMSSSLLATAGGILFTGTDDRWFRAVDDRSGQALWQIRLNAVPNATPVTYTVNGKQYVAITTGGGGPHDSESVELTPELTAAAPATTVWVFGLP